MNDRRFLRSALGVVALLSLCSVARPVSAQWNFIRGDSNASGNHDFTDAINTLEFLFLGTGIMPCADASDADDSGDVDFTDAIFSLEFLFLGNQIVAPPNDCGADPTPDSIGCDEHVFCGPSGLSQLQRIGHLLNRIGYGPTVDDVETVANLGTDAYIQQQLDPESIPENPDLIAQLDTLREERLPAAESELVVGSSVWRYFKGTQAPPIDWNDPGFDDSAWSIGQASLGYGDDDDNTVLADMAGPGGYLTLFLRQEFPVADPASVDDLILQIRYDDGFVAYLNGFEVERENVVSTAYNAGSNGNHEANEVFSERDITAHKHRLVAGTNVLAFQLHNEASTSSDATIDPKLISRTVTSKIPISQYPRIENVKASAHLRGVYSTRRLQIVLGDFWENHFTTEFEKVRDYLFESVSNSDGSPAMDYDQARREAANLEAIEYEFFLDNALGNFGDLLEFSAKSPTMLIYLDNVLNTKGIANENYAREIHELHAFGVDNGYTQTDIERSARVFTGWNICKVAPENAGDPLGQCGSTSTDSQVLGFGAGWKYFKGTREPTPDGLGDPTLEWTTLEFNDSTWFNGSTPIGYGDGDDVTVLSDMRFNYKAVYLRREFELTAEDIAGLDSLVLEVDYDDGFVAYLNGLEAARSANMDEEGDPPPFNQDPDDGREVGITEIHNMNQFRGALRVGTNVLAAQVHNVATDSSDLSFLPRLLSRTVEPGGVENGDTGGVWDFQIRLDQHDSSSKLLFSGRPYQLSLSSHSSGDGAATVAEGDQLFDTLVNAAPTAEFICTKLVRKLVDDSAPPAVVAEAIAAWNSTNPKGNIRTVVEAILTSDEFFNPLYYRSKIKDPLEFVNSSARALDATTDGFEMIQPMDDMGMDIFTREEPDGWPESGFDWVSAGGMLERILFIQDLSGSGNDSFDLTWASTTFLSANNVVTSEEIVDFFNDLLFEGTLPSTEVDMLLEYFETNGFWSPQALIPGTTDYRRRVERIVALMLAMPQWNTQ